MPARRAVTFATCVLSVGLLLPVRAFGTTSFGQFQNKLTPSDGTFNDQYGYSVALDQGLALVGSLGGGPDNGAGYIYDAVTGTQLRKLVATDGIADDALGYSAGLDTTAGSGGVAILGDPRWRRNGVRKGAAYLFNASTGVQIARLNGNDSVAVDEFGVSVTIDSTLALVGARMEDSIKENSGAVYVFNSATGQQLRKLKASDAGLGDQFGTSVDIDGSLAIVGAYLDDSGKGSAYIFDASTGTQLKKLIPGDVLGWTQFGISVAIDNGIALVGSRGANPSGVVTGVAYLFDVATGNQLAALYAPDGAEHDNFGSSVALDNGLAVIGAMEHNEHGAQSGVAYVFDVATHQQLAKLSPNDGAAGDLLGWSVSIDASPSNAGRVLLGARAGDTGDVQTGSAYLFDVARVPEPTGATLAAVAVAAIVSRRPRAFSAGRTPAT